MSGAAHGLDGNAYLNGRHFLSTEGTPQSLANGGWRSNPPAPLPRGGAAIRSTALSIPRAVDAQRGARAMDDGLTVSLTKQVVGGDPSYAAAVMDTEDIPLLREDPSRDNLMACTLVGHPAWGWDVPLEAAESM